MRKILKIAILLPLICNSAGKLCAQTSPIYDYVFSRQPLVSSTYAELPLGSIKAKGWLLKQLELQAAGFTGHAEELYQEADNLGANSDWLGGTGNSWERVPYYVKGLVALAYTLDDASLKLKAEKWITWTLENQQANGLIGPSKMKDWWPRMPMLYAVKNYYEATGDKRVIPFFSKYFKYQLENLPLDPLKEWSKSRTGDNIEIVLWLYNKTGDAYLLKLADLLKDQAYPWKDIYTNNLFYHFGDDFHTKHAVSVGQALKFPAIYYQRSGDKSYKEAFQKGIDHLIKEHGQSSGIASGTEFLAGKSEIQGVETCTVVEWMQSLETAARIIEDPSIGDRLEKIAFNTLPAQFSRDLKEHLYYTLPNQIQCKYGHNGFDEDYPEGLLLSPYSGMGCCRYNMHMGWPYFVKNSWAATPDKGLAIIAYAPVEVNAVVADQVPIKIVEETDYPFNEQIKLKISLEKSAEFPLRLRIPAWCKTPSIRINGKAQKGLASNRIVLINRRWNDKDELILNFPMEIKVSPQVHNSVSIERGPLVYALQMDAKYVSIKDHPVKGFHDYEVFPVNDWNYGLIFDKKNVQKSFIVEKGVMPENPFVQKSTPVKIKVKAQKLKDWTMSYNGISAFDVPYGPLTSTEPIEEVTLTPFGSENIRISNFPQINGPVVVQKSFTENFDANNMEGWVWYGGGWFTQDGALHAASNKGSWGAGIHGSKVINSAVSLADFVFEIDMTPGKQGNAGIVFRVSKPAIGPDLYNGYYVGINPALNRIEIGKSSEQKYVLLASSSLKVEPEKKYKLKVEAKGPDICVFLDDEQEPVLKINDNEFSKGTIGLRSYDALASYDNMEIMNLAKKE
ncbi:beta-L-arabinofuranosidase domain-containing protein [Arcticibacter eurypsychrophilus]|uniref:beta-L-arabinofuranosidase domain-containing protein n=1 Tax=Arcticibacter eurypsychrophilus TaxID=1434752 RepID=UPI00084D773A|nr:beta-L-arabinofuranosidase domain-containing protein [Arcticibacter eurypsychrophilus]